MSSVTAVIIAIIGSGALQVIVQHYYSHRRDDDIMRKTLAAVAYGVLSNEIERLLTKGFATPDERRSLGILFDAYKANGWNGDMDARMERVRGMPTDRPHYNRRKDDDNEY